MPDIHLHHHQQQHQQLQQQQFLFQQSRPATNSRLGGMKGGLDGEIVEVQGGHIVRSTGRKDRHSKVCTAKGPRDRRVRLSAHTAIQFYDVQDRLGYDRPSKAVDWLIKKAKSAIDELAELPPWHPTATTVAAGATSDQPPEMNDTGKKGPSFHMNEATASSSFSFGGGSSSFLPPSLESDAIADTIKFFFPIASGGSGSGPSSITTAAVASSSTPTGFHQYPPDLFSRSNSHVQDLRLSLQSFQDPILLHHHHQQQQQHSTLTEQSLFGNSSPTWPEQNQRLLHWGSGSETVGGSTTATNTAASGGGASSASYLFNPMSQPQGVPLPLHPLLGQSPFLTQRGPLQSNNSPSILAWPDPAAAAVMSGASTGFTSGSFSGFRIPARIQGEEEHDDGIGISRKPSSAPRR